MSCIELQDLTELELAPGIRARAVHTGNLSVAYVLLEAGAVLPEHAHHHEQVVNVIAGRLELSVAGETLVLEPGRVMVLPPMVPHSGRALSDCRVVDVFHPVREDFLARAAGGGAR